MIKIKIINKKIKKIKLFYNGAQYLYRIMDYISNNNNNSKIKPAVNSIDEIRTYVDDINKTYENDIKLMKEEIKVLEKEKKESTEYKKIINATLTANPITLNVGGIKYQTTKETLTKIPGSYFHQMFSGEITVQKRLNKPNTYFIDRNGSYFRYILNYLRDDGKDIEIPDSIKKEVEAEMLFFKIKKN